MGPNTGSGRLMVKGRIRYGVRPLPSDIRQKRSDPLFFEIFVWLLGPDLLGDCLDIFFVEQSVLF